MEPQAEPEPELMTQLRQALSVYDREKVLEMLQELARRGVKVTFQREIQQRVERSYLITLPSQGQRSPYSRDPIMNTYGATTRPNPQYPY